MRVKTIVTILLTAFLAGSCGEYGKLLKSTDYDLKKTKAKEYFEAGKYVKATELLEQILPRFRASADAEELNWINAQSYYGMRDYMMAGSYFSSLVEQYPFGKYAEEASFMASKCNYNLAPRAALDQEYSRNAIEGFRLYITRYPSSPRVEEAKLYIKELEERLVEKSYLNARLYYDMKQYRAAIVALTNSLKEYSDSRYREEMMFLKLNSLYLYAVNSLAAKQKERYQDALDDYYSFIEEYPKSKYSREVRKIYLDTARFLKIDIKDNLVNLQ
ncbi:MAG: outer membrane protein assembly factor BamD [Bacteroidales bacterium]|nr:outer membrane protein assembly factor BamD [Bacteroidales bacterium]